MTDQTQPAPEEDSGPALPLPVQKLTDAFGDVVIGHEEHRGQLAIQVQPERITDVLSFLMTDSDLRLDHLSDVTAVDYVDLNQQRGLENALRFGVIYQLYSPSSTSWLRIKAMLPEDNATIASVISVFPGANWAEREVYDMFGIHFQGHPNLTRLLTPDDWQGHPLRKDYPLIEEDVEFTVNTSYPRDKIGPGRG